MNSNIFYHFFDSNRMNIMTRKFFKYFKIINCFRDPKVNFFPVLQINQTNFLVFPFIHKNHYKLTDQDS
ncbi:hypothetical protein BpHYR1_013196 [Brachionus plicatilis]|uniref:Uncharacterized protein n=1 Tax=Brachionus plicatilis TaxID=10195 RepID=A0A3M7RT75_BRAPC|nr:hypothetical protein BpHYR1_013196 [Brachionus plicatilis]